MLTSLWVSQHLGGFPKIELKGGTMIKRNSRNIGKAVVVQNYHKDWDGRAGKVVDFRGDFDKGDPYVCVFIDTLGAVWSLPGHNLEKL